MRESRLENAMQYLEEDLISQAEVYMPLHKKWYQSAWIKCGVMAAGLLLVVSAIPKQQGSYASHTSSTEKSDEMNVLPNLGRDEYTSGDYVTSKDFVGSLLEGNIIVHHGNKETTTKRNEFGVEGGIIVGESGSLLTSIIGSDEESDEDNNKADNGQTEENNHPGESKEESSMKRKLLLVGILFIAVGLCIGGIAIKLGDAPANMSKEDENISETEEDDDLQFFAPSEKEDLSGMEPTEPLTNEGKLATVSGIVMDVSDQGILIRYGEDGGNVCRLMIGEEVNVQVTWEGSELLDGDISQVVEGRKISATYRGGTDESYPARAYGVSRIIVELPEPTAIMEGTIEKVYEKYILINRTNAGLENGKYSVGTSDDVKIFVGGSEADCSQLRVGQRVLVVYHGGILEIFPAKVTGVLEIIAE